ncbi:MAG TPA: O-antigen ligase family protein [Candidatus Saccharimonadales bacterium]|jgi:O-antigen ligase
MSKVSAFVTAVVAVILVLVPFHAFLTIWAASAFGHYTLLRLWKEILLVPIGLVAVWLLWQDRRLRREAGKSWIFRLMAVYVLLQILLGAIALERHQVNRAALGEGLVEDLRLTAIFFVAWVAASRSAWLRMHWQKLVLIPAAIVVAFGLLQAFVLPPNFLSHFGYGSATIRPFELVDQNSRFVRVQSTLRGANPLGAYLVVIVAALAATFLPKRPVKKFWLKLLLGLAALFVLYFTYSRSAYFGATLAVFGVGWLSIKSERMRLWLLAAAALLCVLVGGAALLLRHNADFEDTFFHTSQLSHSKHSSNQNRTSALENGVHDVLHQPFGRGPGTAGPASVHNNHPARIAENYFLQIGQEAGWLGLAIFLAINILLAKELWKRRAEPDRLPLVLLVSLAGLTFVNLLSHAWADDTLAYVWWGSVGIALSRKSEDGEAAGKLGILWEQTSHLRVGKKLTHDDMHER